MAWTYTDAPATVPGDAVRVLLGDTDSADPQPVSDAEILWFLSECGSNAYLAAAMAAEKLAGYYARQADTSNGSLSVGASARSAAFGKLATRLRARAVQQGGAQVFVGGLTESGKDDLASDSDAVQPMFKRGQDDLPGTGEDADERTDILSQ